MQSMNERQPTLDSQIKKAERDRLLAEAEKIKSEKIKIDLEANLLQKESSLLWFKKKEFWGVFSGSLIAWTAVSFYITFSVVPVSEIHNNQVTLENTKKSDSLYTKERLLNFAYDTLHKRETNLALLTIIVNRQREENNQLKIARIKVDSAYNVFYSAHKKTAGTTKADLERMLVSFKKYFEDYKAKQSEFNSNPIPQSSLNTYGNLGYNSLTTLGSLSANQTIKSDPNSPVFSGYTGVATSIKNDQTDFAKYAMLNLDSTHKVNGFSGFSSNIFLTANTVKVRPLFEGKLIDNAIIHVNEKASLVIEKDLAFELGQFTLDGPLYGEYSFFIKGDVYEVKAIRTNKQFLNSDNNSISFTFASMGVTVIDLVLDKK
jgi:hypothetical protein